ncbi:hypothetical protein PGH45_18305 [Legionella pneumophila]|nr:hypothetical protein [Legionella pneumophila]
METLQVGIMSREKFQRRVAEIAAGRYIPEKMNPKSGLTLLNHFPKY